MFKKFLINRFNKKYSNKELYFCEKLYSDILFWPFSVHTCCHCTKIPYSPPLIFPVIPDKFSFANYLTTIGNIMNSNQTSKAPCAGCKFLKKQLVPQFKYEKNITFFTINHFTKCNSNCVYCGIGRKTEDIKYKLLPLLKQIFNEKLIADNCLFNWGGGEPTLCSEFEEIARFLHKNNLRQAINSSGIIFSPTILDGLKDGSMSIQISPDSGTQETYLKIKRQNNFNIVWDNIKKYSQYPDMLFVKYIFFSMSANETDVRMFINKCIESKVKHIVIDCESQSANNPRSPFGKINDEIIHFAVLMKHLAVDNNINYEISYQWREEHRAIIENS
ncbi:MAG: radical SAM protein [Candidatus Gastranaerophilales bacterium]|nr:radical SAM protein [Candidatus Gastranaerophilales bacterium]